MTLTKEERAAMAAEAAKNRAVLIDASLQRLRDSGLPLLTQGVIVAALDEVSHAVTRGAFALIATTSDHLLQRQAMLLLLDIAIANITGVRDGAMRIAEPYLAKERS